MPAVVHACALPSDHRPKIQPVIATFSAGEFRRQPALSDNTDKAAWVGLNPGLRDHFSHQIQCVNSLNPRSDQYTNSPCNFNSPSVDR